MNNQLTLDQEIDKKDKSEKPYRNSVGQLLPFDCDECPVCGRNMENIICEFCGYTKNAEGKSHEI